VKTAYCGSLEHPNVMVAEDVSEQLTTIEETILKLAEEKEIVEIGSAEKLEFDYTCCRTIKTCFT
jgi:exonuclease SbcC